MYKKLLITIFVTSAITACNPKEPRINRVKEEIEKIEEERGPKEIDYGPTPGG